MYETSSARLGQARMLSSSRRGRASGPTNEAKIYLNGRFLRQRQTGVQRYARETVLALDALLAESRDLDNLDLCLLAPKGEPLPRFARIRTREVGPFQGHVWEQLTLPLASRDGLLWSFAATGPLLRRHQTVTVHDASIRAVPDAFSWKFRVLYGAAIPLLTRNSPQVMTVSEFSRKEVARHFGVNPDALKVSGEGWEHTSRISADQRILMTHGLKPRRYVLAVSSVTPHKNFAVVGRALARLAAEDYRVVIAGEVNARVFGEVSPASMQSVEFVGYVSDAELKALYENAGVFVYPSLYEGFGLPPLEAMACGCPVLASRAASMPEVCGDAALYFEPHDDAALARLIERVMTNDEERSALAARGLAQLEQHSWAGAAKAHMAAMQQALGLELLGSRCADMSRFSGRRARRVLGNHELAADASRAQVAEPVIANDAPRK
jgi:glycosyltransferase involved in cell wall biosynthesis